jgi:transposase
MLHRVWTEQYLEEAGTLRWRTPEEMPAPAELISSPYDPDARYSTKQSMEWVGYKVHLTETCDLDRPHLIVNVETTPASTPDDPMVAVIHASLAQQNRLPAEHLVDKGYTDAQVLLDSQNEYQVAITGPVAEDPSWQARAGTGFDKAHFQVDWNRRVVTCPAGHQSRSWLKNSYPKNGVVWEAHFSRQDCTPCPFRAQCTHAKVEPRIIGLQTREQHEVLQVARHRQTTEEFRAQYAARAGIESTHEQAIRRCGLRHSRYIGLAKTHLQQVITATAVNLIRLGEWWAGTPLAPTRISRFAQLNPLAQAA